VSWVPAVRYRIKRGTRCLRPLDFRSNSTYTKLPPELRFQTSCFAFQVPFLEFNTSTHIDNPLASSTSPMKNTAVPGDSSAPNSVQPRRGRSRHKTTPDEVSSMEEPVEEPVDSPEPLRTTRSRAAATGLVLERVENWGPPPKGAKKRKDAKNQAAPTTQVSSQSISQDGGHQTVERYACPSLIQWLEFDYASLQA